MTFADDGDPLTGRGGEVGDRDSIAAVARDHVERDRVQRRIVDRDAVAAVAQGDLPW